MRILSLVLALALVTPGCGGGQHPMSGKQTAVVWVTIAAFVGVLVYASVSSDDGCSDPLGRGCN